MKIKNLNFAVAGLLLLGVSVLSSCSKALDTPQYPQSGVAYVSVVHASPRSGALDFAFDNNRVNLNFFNYTDRVNYVNAFAGTRGFYVYPKGASNALISKNISLTPGKNYTIFIADTLSKRDAVLIRDSSRAPGADSVRIRLVNMSPDAGNLDLYLEDGSTPIVTNVPYKSAAEFVSLKAANTVALEVRPTGQLAAIAKSATINLVTGNFYTIWTAGFKSITTDDARLRVETFWH